MKIETKDRYFKETVEQLKEWGVLWCMPQLTFLMELFRYGWVTDGTHILYFLGEHKGYYYVNGYDENLNSVWDEDRVIVCAEETLFLTMCCGL